MLGFRRHFQGNPGHLLIKTVAEPVEGSRSQRRYLVIYDGVPGGTGTLVELWNKDGAGLHAVLSRAVEALRACSCANLSGRDGCYRCIYAYQSRFDLPRISRSRALAMLRDVLREWPKMKEVATLSDTSLDDRLESELERRFVGKLAEGVRSRARAGSDESGAAWSEVCSPPGKHKPELRPFLLAGLPEDLRATVEEFMAGSSTAKLALPPMDVGAAHATLASTT